MVFMKSLFSFTLFVLFITPTISKANYAEECIDSLGKEKSYSLTEECKKIDNPYSLACVKSLGKELSYSLVSECRKVTNEFSVKCAESLGKEISYSTLGSCVKINDQNKLSCVLKVEKSYSTIEKCSTKKAEETSDESLPGPAVVETLENCVQAFRSEPSCLDSANAQNVCKNIRTSKSIKLVQACLSSKRDQPDYESHKADAILLCTGSFTSSSSVSFSILSGAKKKKSNDDSLCNNSSSDSTAIYDSPMIKKVEQDSEAKKPSSNDSGR